MSKMNSRYQITLPQTIINESNIDINRMLCLYVYNGNLVIDNPSSINYSIPCLGRITLNAAHTFTIHQHIRCIFNFNPGDEIEFSIYKGKPTFKRIL